MHKSGFKTREDYNAYMREYQQKKKNRVAFLEMEVERLNKLLTKNAKYVDQYKPDRTLRWKPNAKLEDDS
jgi:hypothetical protein